MSWQEDLAAEPWRFNVFSALARHEALHPDQPRLGDSATRRDEYLDLGQHPHLDFGPANTAGYEPRTSRGKARLRARFLGLLGPMGPLPSHMTEEALDWLSRRDDAFVRFLDIFNNRFLQLFYRAHADCRPAHQAARPADDRFRDYVGAAMGQGGPAWRDLDQMADFDKLAFAGLLGPRTVSAGRIAQLVTGLFQVDAAVEPFIGTMLVLAPEDQTRLGRQNAGLGTGAMAGARVPSVETRFRLRIAVATLAEYEAFLPGRDRAAQLADAVMNAVGLNYDWDVELVLSEGEVPGTALGRQGQLGWTSWLRDPARTAPRGEVRTRFSPVTGDGTPA